MLNEMYFEQIVHYEMDFLFFIFILSTITYLSLKFQANVVPMNNLVS